MPTVAKHVFVFFAALTIMWLAGMLPITICKPGIYAGLTQMQLVSEFARVDPLLALPICMLLAGVQWVVFARAPKLSALVYLGLIAAAWSAFAWFWMWLVFYSDFGA